MPTDLIIERITTLFNTTKTKIKKIKISKPSVTFTLEHRFNDDPEFNQKTIKTMLGSQFVYSGDADYTDGNTTFNIQVIPPNKINVVAYGK